MALAHSDADSRFRAMAARGDAGGSLALLDKLDRAFSDKRARVTPNGKNFPRATSLITPTGNIPPPASGQSVTRCLKAAGTASLGSSVEVDLQRAAIEKGQCEDAMDSGLHFRDFAVQKNMGSSLLRSGGETVDGFVNELPNDVMNPPVLAFEPDPSRFGEMKLNVSETGDNLLDGITQKMVEGNFREEHEGVWAWCGPWSGGCRLGPRGSVCVHSRI